MAPDRLTLLDIAKMNGADPLVGLIEEATKAHPETIEVPGRTIKGTSYKTLVRTKLPTVGFRNGNQGADATKSSYENRTVETYILNPRWEQDKAIADAYEDGAAACIAIEAAGQMEASLLALGKQFFYGTSFDAKGFPGLCQAYDSTNMLLDAGGTTDSVCSSVWMIRRGPKAVQWVFGMEGNLSLSAVREQLVPDSQTPPKYYTAYVQEMLVRPGLQVGSVRAVCRGYKFTEDAGLGVTDAALAKMLEKFPAGLGPDAIFMSKRSRRQLKNSRTAVNPTGLPAPFPVDYEGIPIFVTECLYDTEVKATGLPASF